MGQMQTTSPILEIEFIWLLEYNYFINNTIQNRRMYSFLSAANNLQRFDTFSQVSTESEQHEHDWGCSSTTQMSKSSPNKPNQKIKTSLCKKFSENGYCPYGQKCQFAHGVAELRCKNDDNKYKTRPCNTFFKKSYCSYGSRCNFSHTIKSEEPYSMQERENLSGFRELLYNGSSAKGSRIIPKCL